MGFRRMQLAIFVAMACGLASAVARSQTVTTRGAPDLHPKVALGWLLFEDPRLSLDESKSCASCHDPLNSFADGLAEAKGLFDLPTGRNSAVLYGAEHLPGYPDPRGGTAGVQALHVLGLEERCLAPIENPQEMGASIDLIVHRLNRDGSLRKRFDRTFQDRGNGVTKDRLGQALAAYVRALRPPPSPYGDWLLGDVEALSPKERAGLDVFRYDGQCAACHKGPALSDGLMHPVMPTREAAATATQRRNQFVAVAQRIEQGRESREGVRPTEALRLRKSVGGAPVVYYGPQQITRQTLPLWDVARTGPYFRDGTINDLETAVKEHMTRLRSAKSNPSRTVAAIAGAQLTGQGVPAALSPKYEMQDMPIPGELTPDDLDHLMAFLHALSPRTGRRGSGQGDD